MPDPMRAAAVRPRADYRYAAYIESHLSPGGLPVHTGWMADGMWVAITLDNVAEAHLARGNGDAAAATFMRRSTTARPLYTWCEERGQEPGTSKCSGDRQHLWTPVAVVRAIRDSLVLEDGDGLQLALGATAPGWPAASRWASRMHPRTSAMSPIGSSTRRPRPK